MTQGRTPLSGQIAFSRFRYYKDVLRAIDAYTQTVGVYPESLKEKLKDVLPLYGTQRLVSLGFAIKSTAYAAPQDAIEPLRRMCKWVVNEHPDDRQRIWEGAPLH
jgi:hypothetical protein